jgi:cysteine-rich repeat protein
LFAAATVVSCAGTDPDSGKQTPDGYSHYRCGTRDVAETELVAFESTLDRLVPEAATPDRVSGSVTIPVHVHVIQDAAAGSKLSASLEDQITKQIQVLNDDYSGKQGGHNTAYRFQLVTPIDVVQNQAWYHVLPNTKEERDMKTALRKGGVGDLNLYFAALGVNGRGLLGWSTFPQDYSKDPIMDGVVVLTDTLPGGPAAPYNLGATAVHEIGHWLGLYHTFQNGCKAPGDSVKDTPREAAATFGCPSTPPDTCPSDPGQPNRADPIHNYEDYTDDACMSEFTHDQAIRMNRLWKIRAASCGDGKVDFGELCDTGIASGPGSCPTSCDDGDKCTTDTLNNPGTCQAECKSAPVPPKDNDGCCPTGANASNDNDCPKSCGNGVVDPGETCDTGIASGNGSCPTAASCDDGNPCTTDSVEGEGTCNAKCKHDPITTPKSGDMCCPPGANSGNDSDCAASCGNGIVDPGEKCDTGIASGKGSCPTSCDDGDACTKDTLLDPGTCNAQCQSTPITTAANNDGCCPPGANSSNDNDCAASCGNGVVDPGETCDTGIHGGRGSCPTSCDDGDACTTDTLQNAGTCTAACASTPITTPANDDGCCPRGANANNDNDCKPVCGNHVVEHGEECDDGNTDDGDGCSHDCKVEVVPPTGFRIVTMQLADPHIYFASFGCSDLTSVVNGQLSSNLTGDADNDGFLDLSPVAVFRPLAQGKAGSSLDFLLGKCKKADGTCSGNGVTKYSADESNITQGTCLVPGADHYTGYDSGNNATPVNSVQNNCMVTASTTLEISLQGTSLTLQDAQIAAVYSGNPATGLTSGLVRGFLSKADADNAILPANLPLVGGKAISALLGGFGNCTSAPGHDDTDTFNGQQGWYFYLNFTAQQGPYAD